MWTTRAFTPTEVCNAADDIDALQLLARAADSGVFFCLPVPLTLRLLLRCQGSQHIDVANVNGRPQPLQDSGGSTRRSEGLGTLCTISNTPSPHLGNNLGLK